MNSLSDTTIKNAKPKDKPYKMFDGGGLYVEVSPAGGKLWRLKYRFGGKEKRLSFGAYPAVSLKDARERRDEAKKMLANGKDPGAVKQASKAAIKEASINTFEAVAREWFEAWSAGVSPATASRQWANLERNVFPILGGIPVSEVRSKTVLDTLRAVEVRGICNTVLKAKTAVSQIMRYAVQTDRAENDPVPNLKGAIKKPVARHMASLTDTVEVGALLRGIDQYQGQPEVCAALKLAPLLFVRIGELRAARWADIDFERAQWRYTVSKTKTDHLVPLARQAVEILRGLYPISGGKELVFPGLVSGKPISNSTINQALRRLGYDTQTEMTGHGFRAMARTLLSEELHYPPEVIEHQLAHRVPDVLGAAYNRTKFIKQRREMMQAWANYLDKLKAGAEVIPLRA
ncbi:MAG: integrase arm-type DNA-binding domain-containing protein [Betaproteobacteria bacterium]|nr:integrase arm-type DNA-binding domain-containing protein [Betaproteobacteria bacterium]